MKQSKEVAFLDIFEELGDPRSERNRLYSMSEILLVTVCGIICGAEGWQDIEDFGKVKLECKSLLETKMTDQLFSISPNL